MLYHPLKHHNWQANIGSAYINFSIPTNELKCFPPCFRIIIICPLSICHCDYIASSLARPTTKPAGTTVWLTGNWEIGEKMRKETLEEGRVQRETGKRLHTLAFDSLLGRVPGKAVNWCKKVEESSREWHSRRERKIILLIQLSGVIAPDVTGVQSTSVTFNGVCECQYDSNFDCHFSSCEIRFTNKILTHTAFNLLLISVHLDKSVWTWCDDNL